MGVIGGKGVGCWAEKEMVMTMLYVRLVNYFRYLKNERGVTAIEYGLIAGLIGIVIIGAVRVTGQQLEILFNTVRDALLGIPNPPAQ